MCPTDTYDTIENVNIGLSNGLLLVQSQANTWTNADK